jgi:hypothetical protein
MPTEYILHNASLTVVIMQKKELYSAIENKMLKLSIHRNPGHQSTADF